MMIHLMRYFILRILIALIFISPILAEEKNDLNKLNNKISELKKSLVGDGESQESLNDQLEKTELSLAKIVSKIRAFEKKIDSLNRRIENLNEQKNNLAAYLRKQQYLIKNYIKFLHRQGTEEPLKLILKQQNPKNINRILEYYNYFINARNEKINSYKEKIKELNITQKLISAQKLELMRNRSELRERKNSFLSLQSSRSLTMKKLNSKINSSKLKLALYADQKANLEILLRKKTHALNNYSSASSKNNFYENKGKLPWPVNAYPSNKYDLKSNSSMHSKGWLLKTNAGSPVRVVHDGKIIFANYLKGLGLLMIVSHGDGFMTLYAHNQFLLKKMGDWVLKGEDIARVGNTGGLDEHALYFEVRKNGKPSNPKFWLLSKNY
jgi:septal ring factor EnvC (AmiA/AmiB activator)